jgi:hypothetical protein
MEGVLFNICKKISEGYYLLGLVFSTKEKFLLFGVSVKRTRAYKWAPFLLRPLLLLRLMLTLI